MNWEEQGEKELVPGSCAPFILLLCRRPNESSAQGLPGPATSTPHSPAGDQERSSWTETPLNGEMEITAPFRDWASLGGKKRKETKSRESTADRRSTNERKSPLSPPGLQGLKAAERTLLINPSTSSSVNIYELYQVLELCFPHKNTV